MRKIFWGKEKEYKFFLTLDIESDLIRCLIFQIRKGKIFILAHSLEYFENSGFFATLFTETEILKKTIQKAIIQAENNLLFSLKDEKLKKKIKEKNFWRGLVVFPPSILKAEIVSVKFIRKEPSKKISKKEKEDIFDFITERAREKISDIFEKKFGILRNEIKWLDFDVLEIKINGYNVPCLLGFSGKEIELKVLSVFAVKDYFQKIKKMMQELGLRDLKIVHKAEGIRFYLEQEKKEGFFVEIENGFSRIFWAENGILKEMREFSEGAELFSQGLAEDFGLDESTARDMIIRYCARELTPETSEKIKEMLLKRVKKWTEKLIYEIKKIGKEKAVFFDVFLFGNLIQIPELQETIKKEIGKKPKILSLDKLKKVENSSKNQIGPEFFSSLLVCYYYLFFK